ncbi:1-phosphofructokinase family hexose kinase [Motilibacter deserti]|uniref:1-phosphofructokinase family hexose kinase n=1 Tax=Motilibacter deserti TaxID=2714956 RepID=UPI002F2B21B2
MILTVTANPALDVTYRLPALAPGRVHRVREVLVRAGGKGVNVARVLRQLGEPVVATGLGGGPDGARLVEELRAEGVEADFLDELPDVRRTLVVSGEDGVVTSLWEPGRAAHDPGRAADRLVDAVAARLAAARAVTVSGSLPPGVDAALPARIARAGAARGVPVVLDLDGAALVEAARVEGCVLMPNLDELEVLAGARPQSAAEAADAVREVVARPSGPAAVVATLGEQGVVVATRRRAVHARPVETLAGNPTGAGDAACAAVARALAAAGSAAALELRPLAADVVAVSAAAVLRPVAGEVDVAAADRWRPLVPVEEL